MIIDIYDNRSIQIGTLYDIDEIKRYKNCDPINFFNNGRCIFKLSYGFYKRR